MQAREKDWGNKIMDNYDIYDMHSRKGLKH